MKTLDDNSPFEHTRPVTPPIFAGRSKELKIINNALYENKDSLILFGNDAIGKSSIIKTIYENLNLTKQRQILPVWFSAFDFIKAVECDFLGLTIRQICGTIWTECIKKSYSILLENDLAGSKTELFQSPEENALVRIFRLVSNEKFTGSGKSSKEIGGKIGLEGKISRENEIGKERKSFATFEFLYLVDELNGIINSFGFQSIIVFCDELNHLPETINTEILRNYFSIFSSKKIQFVIVAVNPEMSRKEDARQLIESFNYQLEIGPFKKIEDVKELVKNSSSLLKHKIEFEDECIDFLFKNTEGHPWWIQKICDSTYAIALIKKFDKIDISLIEKCYLDYQDEILIYKNRIAAGLPFRKRNLNQ